MFVHVPGAFQKLLHGIEAVLERQREHTHGGAHGVSAADPVPKGKRVVGVDAKLLHELEVGGHGDHVLLDRLRAEGRDDPLAHGARVEHRLRGGERLYTTKHDQISPIAHT